MERQETEPIMLKRETGKIRLYSEGIYVFSLLLLSFSVAMVAAADFGVSMIVAPAYILSQKLQILTFGQCEYVIQGLLFIVFCLLMKKVKLVYFSSFITCIIYGAMLDAWRSIIPVFNPAITSPGSMAEPLRIFFFIAGMVLTSLSIALVYRIYLYPQVYDFFVKGISQRFHKDRTRFKMIFDGTCLLVSVGMTLLLFRGFVGIGVGTIIMTCLNGLLIGRFDKLLEAKFEFVPAAKRFADHFDLDQ